MARFSFSGDSVSLNKGDVISLEKNYGEVIKNFHIGLGWDILHDKNADLDAYVLEMDENDKILDIIYYGQLNSKDGAIKHTGDNLTGAGEGDDEVINIAVDRINPKVTKLVVAVTIYTANINFSEVQNAFVRLVDAYDETEFVRYDLSNEAGKNYTMHMADIYRQDSGRWDFTAIGQATQHKSIREFANSIASNTIGGVNTSNSNGGSNNRGGGFFRNLFR